MKAFWIAIGAAIIGALYLIFAGGSTGNILTGNLSAAQIAAYAANAGFQGNDLATAVAVALAESGGNPQAYNPETATGAPANEGSYGLWQIFLFAHPEDLSLNLYDPQTNANAAFAIYQAAGSKFSPWSTFKGGQYQAFLGDAEAALA